MALLKKTFVLSDESVNRYKFRVLTNGIELGAFLSNPVVLLKHDRTLLPIGKWENIRKEGVKLLAEPNFDDSDPLAMSVQKKVEQGILSAVSIGFDFIEVSDDEKLMLPGQKLSTVTKCELLEVSIVDIPANRNAIALTSSAAVCLGDDMDIGELENLFAKASGKGSVNPNSGMKSILKTLSLAEDASEVEVVLAIKELQAKAEQHGELALALALSKGLKAEAEAEAFKQELAAKPITLAGAVLLAKATAPAQLAPAVPSAPAAKPNLAPQLHAHKSAAAAESGGEGAIPEDRLKWSFNDWSKQDPDGLLKLKYQSPADYERLFKAQYGHVKVGK